MFRFNFADPAAPAQAIPSSDLHLNAGYEKAHAVEVYAEVGHQICWQCFASPLPGFQALILPTASMQVDESPEMDEIVISESLTLLKGRISTSQTAALLGQEEMAASDLIPGRYEGVCVCVCACMCP
jgi:hypothetical protein